MIQIKSRTRQGALIVRGFVMALPICPRHARHKADFRQCLRSGLFYKHPAERPTIPAYQSTAPEIRYFDELGPVSADSNDTLVAGFHEIGPSVATGFEWQEVDEATRRGLSRATKTAEQIIDRL